MVMKKAGTWKEHGEEYFRQGNWKRRAGVATRHELVISIDRLIAKGRIDIVNGELRVVGGEDRPMTLKPEERWARQDEELRSYNQQMTLRESFSVVPMEEYEVVSQGVSLEATLFRSEPRRHVAVYVLRELRHPMGARGYESVIDTIFKDGGWEWVLEAPRKAAKGAVVAIGRAAPRRAKAASA